MKRLIIISIYLSVLVLGISCSNQAERVKPILQKAESLLEQNPDSALVVLNEITNAQKLKTALYYEYYLVQLQSKYKSDKDITADTLVFAIRDYYDNKNDIEKTALATYYSGRVFQEQKDYEKALQQLLDAEQYLTQSKNFKLKALCQSAIGNIYSKQYLDEKAVSHYKLAKGYFHQAENYKNEISVSNMVANSLVIMEQPDSAFTYYTEALTLADNYKYKRLQSAIRMNLGVAYKETGNWNQAEIYFKEAMEFVTDSLSNAKLASNFAKVYEQQGKNDSAIVYLQKALNYLPHEQSNSTAAAIYNTWTKIEENRDNYREALVKHKLYSKKLAQILSENKNAALMSIEAKYNFQLIENQNKQLLIERQRNLVLSLLVLFGLGGLFFFLFRRSVQNKKKLNETEQKVRQLSKLAKNFDDKEESFRNILIQHFDILKKAALLEGYLKEDERKKGQPLLQKFNEVVYGQKKQDWDVLYQTLNKLNNGFLEQFKNQFPQLDESEFRICCLLYVEFNNTEIAIVLNYSINTVQAKKKCNTEKIRGKNLW